MHDLATIIALNEKATQRCEKCQTARITLESRTPKAFLLSSPRDGKDRLLCSSCVQENG